MAKIGRNDRCPCGSGLKFKHCCAGKAHVIPATPPPGQGMVAQAVAMISRAAHMKKAMIHELGVFVLFATERGNAWLLEATQSDCVQVAREGVPLTPDISETIETIEVEWSHTFRIEHRQLVLTAYQDRQKTVLTDCPLKEVAASLKKVLKKFPPEVRADLHIEPDTAMQE